MKKLILNTSLFIAILISGQAYADIGEPLDIDYYFKNTSQYNIEVPTPESSLGYQVGEWHVRPEQIERYFIELAKSSPRIKLHTYAYSHEKRPLFLAYISSPENINNLERLRKQHLLLEAPLERPAVTWMGYSVHGNEPSGSNASLLFAYHLTAANDPQTLQQLDKQIIIIDPMINPDGLARFAHWANMYKSSHPVSDPQTREHNEVWPRGRTNHYWFDLNRDWLLLQHPESRGRIKMFHDWKPNVVTDFHEMGTNSTYFFQPGVKSRQNPLTPKENFELTAKIATYHAKALDRIGSLYYSKENFDDFYYGKGSTYPDINGSIGILFEQASARGHIQDSVNGELTFPFAIKNHLTTSISTLKAVQENRKSLLLYQQKFFSSAKLKVRTDKSKGIVYGSTDQYRLQEFNKILSGHKIEFYPLARSLNINQASFKAENSYVIPMKQTQFLLIKALFEKRDQFEDNTFYDVSSWTMPVAFDIDFQFLNRSDYNTSLLGSERPQKTIVFEEIEEDTVALAFNWKNFHAVNLLQYLHKNEILVRVVGKPLKIQTKNGLRNLGRGDLVVQSSSKDHSREKLAKIIRKKITELGLEPIKITSGLAISGPDIGSPSLPVLKPIKPFMLIGEKVNSYQAGEVWHLLDKRFNQDLTMMTITQYEGFDVTKYTHMIMVGGRYELKDKIKRKIDTWIKSGGILITQSGASEWASKQNWFSSQGLKLEPETDTKLNYAQLDDIRAKHIIGGAIGLTEIDISHPLGYGFIDNKLAVFKRGQFSFTEPKEPFVAFARFASQPLVAGYMSDKNRKNLSGKTSILTQGYGKGKIIAFSDDMNFRGFWLGTSRVFANALYFGTIIKTVEKTKEDSNVTTKITTKADQVKK